MSKKRKILFSHEAWWFLHNHPKFRLPYRYLVDEDNVQNNRTIVTMTDGTRIYQDRHMFHYGIETLDIHYTLVNSKGTTDADAKDRIYTECWLEWGPPFYQGDFDTEQNVSRLADYGPDSLFDVPKESYVRKSRYHDWKLDCGAPTFDEALVKLANLVLKHYGDYVEDNDEMDICGGPDTCLECKSSKAWREKYLNEK